jgi:hypothetical protein
MRRGGLSWPGRVLGAVALVLLVLGCSGSDDSAPTVRDLDAAGRDLVVEYMTLLQRGDTAALDRFLSPAFQVTRADGAASDKAAYLTNPPKVETFEISTVHAAQDGAVLTVRWAVKVNETIDGKPVGVGEAPRLSTFVWSDGRWRLTSHANFNKPAS